MKSGARVVATARNPHTLTDIADRYGDRLLALSLDVTQPDAWRRAVEHAIERFGRIDVLVNNAGFGGLGSVEEMPLDLIRDQFETNFMGALHACKAVLPVMRAQGDGQIILVSSIGARIATPGAAVYYASKAAVSSLAETLALEVVPFGIKVTAVEPGGMKTRFAEPQSLKISTFDRAYDATVGATVAMMQSPEFAAAQHDPDGHASMILALASLDNPPSRLLAGADAYDYGVGADAARSASDSRWQALSRSATHAVGRFEDLTF